MTVNHRRIVFVAAGQGAQYAGMGSEIYARHPSFRRAFDELLDKPGSTLSKARSAWLNSSAESVDRAQYAQILILALSIASFEALGAHGVVPDAVLGHSAGELGLALSGGLIPVNDRAPFIEDRANMMDTRVDGSMCAVRAPSHVIETLITAHHIRVWIACINSPEQCLVAGDNDAVDRFIEIANEESLVSIKVPADFPFHSPLVRPLALQYERLLSRQDLQRPAHQVMSASTGRWLTPDEAESPRFWADQLWRPVHFWDAVNALLSLGDWTFVDLGPGSGLSAIISRHPKVKSGTSEVVSMLPRRSNESLYVHWLHKVQYLL